MPADLQPLRDTPLAASSVWHPFARFYERFDDRRGCAPLLALIALLGSALACARPELAAHWRQREIQIDGALADWQGWQVAVQGVDARLAVANDESYLYLSLATTDPELVREISRRGLNVWFDPAGGKAETLGLRLPPAGPRFPGPGGRLDVGDSGERERSAGGAGPERRLPPPPAGRAGGIEILGPGRGEHRWISGAEAEASGFRSAMAHDASLVYELRVPLAAKEGWSLSPKDGGRLGIGLTFAQPEESSWTGARKKDRAELPGPEGGGGPLSTSRAGGEAGPLGGDGRPTGQGLPPDSAGVIGGTVAPGEGPGGLGGPGGAGAWGPHLGPPEVWAVFRLASPGGK